MVKFREIPLTRVFLAFLIACFVFLSAFLIGYTYSYYKYQQVSQQQEALGNDLLDLNLESNFINSCESIILESISNQLDNMGSNLGILETRLGKSNGDVIEQKKKYFLLEVQHFLNIKKFKETCNKNFTVIFFFYSNSQENKDNSDKAGFILTNVKARNPETTMIYSFDYDSDLNMIKVLKKVYNVTQANTIVINEKVKLVNILNIDEINKYLF